MTVAASANPSRSAVLLAARAWIGTPYHHQGATKGVGCDCLGLLRGVYRELYGDEPEAPPPYTPSWAEDRGTEALCEASRRHLIEIDPASAVAGDVLLFRWRAGLPAKHCAILTAPARMIHAYDGHAVLESWIPDTWARRIAFAFAFPGV